MFKEGCLKEGESSSSGSPGRGRLQVKEAPGQKKSPWNASWPLLLTSNALLHLFFLGPIFWSCELNERQAIFFGFHLDWKDQVSKGRIISSLLWRLCLDFSHFDLIVCSSQYATCKLNAILLLVKDMSLALWPNDSIFTLGTMNWRFDFIIAVV